MFAPNRQASGLVDTENLSTRCAAEIAFRAEYPFLQTLSAAVLESREARRLSSQTREIARNLTKDSRFAAS